MKFKIFYLALALVLFVGCSKSDQIDLVETNSLPEIFVKFKNEPDKGTQKLIYELFSPAEKAMFWQQHFKMLLHQEKFRNDIKKIELIKDLERLISSNLFIIGTSENSIATAYYMPLWLKKAKSQFTDAEIFDIAYSNYLEDNDNLEKLTQYDNSRMKSNDETEEIGGGEASCFCHVGETGFSCKQLNISPSGGIKYGMCERPWPCPTSDAGCGWFWLSSCNGAHCNFG